MSNTVYDLAYKGRENQVKDAVAENPGLVTAPDSVSFLLCR